VADLVEALVDVWTTLGLPFTASEIIPLRRAEPEAVCVYPEMKRAAE
jgi:5-aminolevulinate synthase